MLPRGWVVTHWVMTMARINAPFNILPTFTVEKFLKSLYGKLHHNHHKDQLHNAIYYDRYVEEVSEDVLPMETS